MTFFCFIKYNINIVHVRYSTIETNEAARIGYMGFFCRISTQVNALVLRTPRPSPEYSCGKRNPIYIIQCGQLLFCQQQCMLYMKLLEYFWFCLDTLYSIYYKLFLPFFLRTTDGTNNQSGLFIVFPPLATIIREMLS